MNKRNLLLIVFSTIIFYEGSWAQETANRTPHKPGDLAIPHMWIDKVRSKQRIQWFGDNKYDLLCDAIKKTENSNIIFKTADFVNLVDACSGITGIKTLNVYIASYPDADSRYYSENDKKLLTLIFVPADVDGHDLVNAPHYIISPLLGFTTIDAGTAQSWVDYYSNNVLHSLDETLDSDDVDNYDPKDNKLSDTKVINYQFPYIQEMQEEINYQQDVNTTAVSSIKISFASYTDVGSENKYGRYPNRLIILFGFRKWNAKKTHEVDFNIEDFKKDFTLRRNRHPEVYPTLKQFEIDLSKLEQAWANKDQKKIKEIESELHKLGGGFDNGQLCPANCP